MLVKRIADALRHAAVNLSFENHGIDHRAAIVHHHVFFDLHLAGVRIDLDDHGVHAERRGAALRPEIGRGFETGLGARFHRPAQGIGLHRQLAQIDGFLRHPLHEHFAVFQLQVIFRGFQFLAGQFQNLFAHRFRRRVDGIAGHHGAATGERAGAPVELARVAGDHAHVFHIHAELFGGDLRK